MTNKNVLIKIFDHYYRLVGREDRASACEVVRLRFDSESGQSNDFKIGICSFPYSTDGLASCRLGFDFESG